ncbi:MAG: sle, partial [Myxococcaceae bacterium]|nr:sle [Myxococcaceae bacterium]
MLAACSGDPDDELVSDQEDELSADAFKVITHNIWGGHNEGATASLDYVTDQARSFGPDVVMMQEVCEGQVATFKARFPKWDVRYSPMIPVDERCGNKAIGIVLASKWNMSDVQVTDLGVDFGKQFTLLCADLAKPGVPAHGVRACATHLRAWDDADAEPMRIKQTATIHATLEKRIKQRHQAVIVAGDFNTGPHREPLDNMYVQKLNGKLDGKGLFREADQNDKKFFGSEPQKAPDRKCAPNSCRSGQDT